MKTKQSLPNQDITKTVAQQQINTSNNKLLVLIVISVLMTVVISGSAVYLWQKSANKKTIQQPTQSISHDQTSNWKVYTNDEFSLSLNYPDDWILNEKKNEEISKVHKQLVISLVDTIPLQKPGFKKNSSNQVLIYNDRRENTPSNLKDASKSLIDYTIHYIPSISYNSPKITSTSKISISNQQALHYVVEMENPKEYAFLNNKLSITHVYFKGNLWSIELYGDNQSLLNQILSTLKFTN